MLLDPKSQKPTLPAFFNDAVLLLLRQLPDAGGHLGIFDADLDQRTGPQEMDLLLIFEQADGPSDADQIELR